MTYKEADAEIPVTNKHLLLKVWNFIAPNPELHDQQRWAEVHDLAVANNGEVMARSIPDQYVDLLATPLAPEIQCGTTACVAGWTVALAGDKFITRLVDAWVRNGTYTEEDKTNINNVLTSDGRNISISDRAEELLGLTPRESGLLFDGENSRHSLRSMIVDLLNGDLESYDHYQELEEGRRTALFEENHPTLDVSDFDVMDESEANAWKLMDNEEVLPKITWDEEKQLYV